MKRYTWLVAIIVTLAACNRSKTISLGNHEAVPLPLYVSFPDVGSGYFGPLGKKYSLSEEVLFNGQPQKIAVWCSRYSPENAVIHFGIVDSYGAISQSDVKEINPSIESSFTVFDSIKTTLKPKL